MFRRTPISNAEFVKQQIRKQNIQESTINLYPEKPKKKTHAQRALDNINESRHYEQQINRELIKYSDNILSTLVESVIYNGLVFPAISRFMPTTHEKEVAQKITESVVNDIGVHKLKNTFKNGGIYLENWNHMIDKYHAVLTEIARDKYKNCEPQDLTSDDVDDIENNTIKSFMIDSSKSIPKDITSMVADRVEDAVNDFIDNNKRNNFEIKKVYDKAKEKLAAMEPTVPDDVSNMGVDTSELDPNYEMADNNTVQESSHAEYLRTRTLTKKVLQEEAVKRVKAKKREINERATNVFDYMVKAMLESVHKVSSLREAYSVGMANRVNFEQVVNDTKMIYTVLEALNTMNILPMDENSLAETIKSFKNSMNESDTGTGAMGADIPGASITEKNIASDISPTVGDKNNGAVFQPNASAIDNKEPQPSTSGSSDTKSATPSETASVSNKPPTSNDNSSTTPTPVGPA